MTDLDQAIREALGREDAMLLDRIAADPSLRRQVLDAYRGPFGFLNAVGTLAGVAVTMGGAFAIWRFVEAADVKSMLAWAGLAGIALLAIAMIKLWFWLELQRNLVTREIKRLELQVARLASRAS